jgi:hypothetical protein
MANIDVLQIDAEGGDFAKARPLKGDLVGIEAANTND